MTLSTKNYFMDIHPGRRRPFPSVAISAALFLLCIIPGQSWIAELFPGISGIAGINPSLVILDIPTPLPVTIDLILAPGLFLLIYPVVILLYPSRGGLPTWRQVMPRVWAFFAGLIVLLFCLLSGGLIYYLMEDHLTRNVRNGINSFGINADIHLPYPGYENLHLRGSMIIFVCAVIGISICIRKIRKEPGMQKVGPLTREQRMTPYERMMQEKRMKEKQMIQEARMTQQAGMKKKEHKTDKSRQPIAQDGGPAGIEQGTTRPDRNDLPRLCRSQPVMTFKPEAVNYMPMS